MIESKLERVKEPEDPQRCQAVFKHGQCPYRAVPGGDRCALHQGYTTQRKADAKSLRNYRLSQWQARVGEFSDSGQLKSLREEAGILRLLLESVVLKCSSDTELILYSSKIQAIVTNIEKVVTSIHKLESSLGVMIDKLAAQQLASEIVAIIGRHVPDGDVVAMIAEEIGLSIDSCGRKLEP